MEDSLESLWLTSSRMTVLSLTFKAPEVHRQLCFRVALSRCYSCLGDSPSCNSLPTREGVPTAMDTLVFARNWIWSASFKCFAKSYANVSDLIRFLTRRHSSLGEGRRMRKTPWTHFCDFALTAALTDTPHYVGTSDTGKGENDDLWCGRLEFTAFEGVEDWT
jgi:hypothetical protein